MKKRSSGARSAIAIFGGTFDPIHSGHLVVAGAAARRFQLDEIYFVPSSRPPHKKRQELAPFEHRYAMVALACAGKSRFVPSLAEAPDDGAPTMFYSIDTVRGFHKQHAKDKLYFILGADSFLEIRIWRSYELLLDSCDFIIVSRPGIQLEALRQAIPSRLLGEQNSRTHNTIVLRRSTVHLLTSVASNISSTDIRQRCGRGAPIRRLVPAVVEEYIQRQALYR